MAELSLLPGRAVLAIGGADRIHFLDNLLTTELADRLAGALAYGALLTPQGKIVTDLFAHVEPDRVALDVPVEAADDLLRRLGIYRLRAAVTLARTEETVVVGTGAPDPRHPALGARALGSAPHDEAALEAYALRRIEAGVPDAVIDFELGDTFPHDANMDLTGAVDFTKGCFVGQEVVSRMRHRGTARRRTVRVEGTAPLPPPGTPITANGRPLGRLGTAVGPRGLALVRIDKAAAPILAGDVPVTLTPPPGAPFTLGADEGTP